MAIGKIKGNTFERDVSRKLSLWWSKGLNDSMFWRTQSSGGRWTQRNKKGLETLNQGGDISSTHPDSQIFSNFINIECKSYKDINLWSIFTRSKGTLFDWWDKLTSQSKTERKMSMLIAKQNNKPILLIVDMPLDGILQVLDCNFKKKCFIEHTEPMYVYLFDEFINIDSNRLREALEYKRKMKEMGYE